MGEKREQPRGERKTGAHDVSSGAPEDRGSSTSKVGEVESEEQSCIEQRAPAQPASRKRARKGTNAPKKKAASRLPFNRRVSADHRAR